MRICIALEHDVFGAAEAYAISLAKGLEKRGHQVLMLHPTLIRSSVIERLKGAGIERRELPSGQLPRLRAARSALKAFAPQVVHVNAVLSTVILAAWACRIPGRVLTEHLLPLQAHYNWKGAFLTRLTRRATRLLIVFSRANASTAQRIWRRVPIKVISPGVDPPQKVNAGVPSTSKQEGLSLVSVGRLSPEKRIDVLLRAVARLPARDKLRRVVIVGTGPEQERLIALSDELGITDLVDWRGYLSDVGPALDEADVFIHCSEREGFGIAVLEAMAHGTPLIVTDLPALREVVGDTALSIVQVGDSEALASAIASGIMNPRERVHKTEVALARCQRIFSIDAMIHKHEQAYRELLKAR